MDEAGSRRQSNIHINAAFAPSLTTMLLRLEAATSRLEDIATTVDTPTPALNGTPEPSTLAHSSPAPQTSNNTPRASTVTVIPPPPPAKDDEQLPSVVEDFDKLLKEELASFITKSGSLDPLLGEQVWKSATSEIVLLTLSRPKSSVERSRLSANFF
jgi:hypothetical protein